MHHDLRTLPHFFQRTWDGDKTFEIRENTDRGFQKGDSVTLKETKLHLISSVFLGEIGFTGRTIMGEITYVTDYAQEKDYVVFGLDNIECLGPKPQDEGDKDGK